MCREYYRDSAREFECVRLYFVAKLRTKILFVADFLNLDTNFDIFNCLNVVKFHFGCNGYVCNFHPAMSLNYLPPVQILICRFKVKDSWGFDSMIQDLNQQPLELIKLGLWTTTHRNLLVWYVLHDQEERCPASSPCR